MSYDQLAEIAYRTYCSAIEYKTESGRSMKNWKDLSDKSKNAWIEVVKAIAYKDMTEEDHLFEDK